MRPSELQALAVSEVVTEARKVEALAGLGNEGPRVEDIEMDRVAQVAEAPEHSGERVAVLHGTCEGVGFGYRCGCGVRACCDTAKICSVHLFLALVCRRMNE